MADAALLVRQKTKTTWERTKNAVETEKYLQRNKLTFNSNKLKYFFALKNKEITNYSHNADILQPQRAVDKYRKSKKNHLMLICRSFCRKYN